MKRIVLQKEAFNPGLEFARLTGQDTDGAVASFVGQVRAGGSITHLKLEHFPGVTERALACIADEAISRWSLSQAVIIHRVGQMALGEPIVMTAASASHRRAALEAVAYMIDVLKTEAPFWKKEIGEDFERWVEPYAEDATASERWLRQEGNGDD